MPVDKELLDSYLATASTRQTELDKLAAENAAANAKAISDLNKLSGDTNNNGRISVAEQNAYLENKPTKQAGESFTAYNERVTQWYKDQPHNPLTPEQEAAGATLIWKRTGIGGEGKYVVSYPIGTKFDPKTGQPVINPQTGKVVTAFDTNTNTTDNTTNVTNDGRPVGTPPAFIYDAATGKWVMPPKPTGAGSWVWDNVKGWVNTTVNPGSSGATTQGGPTLALNTFKNTLALFFGAQEMSQAWVDGLYKSVSNFYNTGSTIDESLNLALQDVRNNPTLKPFTDRFKGIYALQDRLAAGEAVSVPTIAEYFKTEEAMGDVLRNVGLGDLAKQDFLGDILGKGKSLLEVTNLIDTVFNAIDNAPEALKTDLQTYFPGVDRTSLAKALLTGKEGWAELDKKVKGISVLSAAKSQGITVDLPTASDLALLGTDYAGALSGFQQVKELERGRFLGQTQGIDLTQQETIGATFKKDAAALAKLEKIRQGEYAKFSGSSGRLASRERGSAGLF